MSSMFKKKGGLAFKPKIPSARPRPAAPAAGAAAPPASKPTTVTEDHPPIDSIPRAPSPEPSNVPTTEPPPVEAPATKPQEASTVPRDPSPTPPASRAETVQPQDDSTSARVAAETTSIARAEQSTDATSTQPITQSIGVPVTTTLIPSPTPLPTDTSSQPLSQDTSLETDVGSGPVIDRQLSEAPTIGQSTEESHTGPLPTPAATEPVTSSTETSAEPTQPPIEAPKPKGRKRAPKATSEAATGDEAPKPKKRQRKAPTEGEDAAPKKPRRQKAPNPEVLARKRRARSVTPEDSETQLVDLQTLKMSDLTKDLHIGRKFSRHDELRERERRKKQKSRAGQSESGDAASDASPAPDGSRTAAKKDSPSAPASGPTPASGPQFRIVDGQIVVDQSSLVMDRHARDAAGQGDMEVVEENDFTRLITSNSFMNPSKLKGPNLWTDDETELFYHALRMFGTDFEIISKMFPRKQRRQIKLKFNREERHAPRRINAALTGEKTTKMDLNEYQSITGSDFEPVEVIEARQRQRQEDFEAEQKRIADEQEEQIRKKREELFADEDDGKKKKGKKKRPTVVYGLNGEPITTEE